MQGLSESFAQERFKKYRYQYVRTVKKLEADESGSEPTSLFDTGIYLAMQISRAVVSWENNRVLRIR
jgi:hypothetical protein